jgi:glycosyltransferase involved in cell wall biosynthesis
LTEPPSTILRWTRFASNPHGTGPEKRSAQILALCSEAGLAVDDMRPPARVPRWRAYPAGLAARWRFGARAAIYGRSIGLLGYHSEFYRAALAGHRGARVLIWETTYDVMLPALARQAGFRVIALPHNLEAFVSEAVFADPAYDPTGDFGAEVARLALADSVFAISREERWLLEARGLSPGYLPYYPDPVLQLECAAIRARRVARASPDGRMRGPLLILGSAFNPASARGMATQLEWLARSFPTDVEIAVAGPRSEEILASHARPGVRLLGQVGRDQLVELLASCSAMLVHTLGGAGAVTRIPEALLAGVPIIANPNAARDQFGTPGVHVYESEAEFAALVRAVPPIPPPPPFPASAAAQFRSALARLQASGPL